MLAQKWLRLVVLGRSAFAVCIALAFGLLAAPLLAAPGDLDPSFGVGGTVTTDFPGLGNVHAHGVAIQADGKIVTAGDDFALARYNTDGSLDTSFGGDGRVTTDFGGPADARGVALQADGKIVAAGSVAPAGFCCQFAVARYNTDGSLDTSFDGDGKVVTDLGGALDEARAVAIQGDGKIVAAGLGLGGGPSGQNDFGLVRYNTDGSVDTSFGSGGKVTTDFGGIDSAAGVIIQADGKIVAGGAGGSSNDFALARYNTDGSLDTSFGGDGRVTTDFGDFDRAEDIATGADGKIVAAGVPGSGNFALARYNTDGSLDTSFGGDGRVTTDFGGDDRGRAVAVQADNKIVAAGFALINADEKFALARYNTDGSLDTSFGSGGKVTTDFGDPADVGILCPPARDDCSNDVAEDVAIQADGKIVAAGGAGAGTPSPEFALARYLDSSPNREPVADAGEDQTKEWQSGGVQVTLDGSGSSDPNDGPLTYTWTGPFPEGDGTVTGVNPTVTLLSLGTHTITLEVDDGQATDTDTVDVTVVDATPPEVTAELMSTRLVLRRFGFFRVAFACSDTCDENPVASAKLNGVEVENDDKVLLVKHRGKQKVKRLQYLLVIKARHFELEVTCTDASGNSATATATPVFRRHRTYR